MTYMLLFLALLPDPIARPLISVPDRPAVREQLAQPIELEWRAYPDEPGWAFLFADGVQVGAFKFSGSWFWPLYPKTGKWGLKQLGVPDGIPWPPRP